MNNMTRLIFSLLLLVSCVVSRGQDIKPITGTFVNLFYQDVRNKYMNPYGNATDQSAMWHEKIGEMANMDINTLVFMAVANNDSAAYPSRIMPPAYPAAAKESPVDAIMAEADARGMQVFMSIGWAHDQDDDISKPAIRQRQVAIMRELAEKYGNRPSFHGWYLPVEGCICPMFTDKEVKAVNELAAEARRATPGKKVLISPYGIYLAELDNPKFGEQLKKLKVDIVAYQDEIGCVREANPMVRLRDNWKKLVAYHREAGIDVWANCECFTWERDANSRTSALIPSAFPRLLDQMAMASAAGVSKIIAFSVCGIMDNPAARFQLGQPLWSNVVWRDYVSWKSGRGDNVLLGTTLIGEGKLKGLRLETDDAHKGLVDNHLAMETSADKRWLVLQPGDHSVTFDLGSATDVDVVMLRGLQDSGHKVSLPSKVCLYGSDDGQTFSFIAVKDNPQFPNKHLDVWIDNVLFKNLHAKCRFLRLAFSSSSKTALDEVFVNPK